MRNDFCSNYVICHGLFGFGKRGAKKGSQKKDHKYYKRIEKPNGTYRYFYSAKEYLAYLNENKEKVVSEKLNKLKNKGEKTYNDLVKNNKYISNDYNYNKKVEQVKNTKEWQDIVKRKDPEYVYKDKNGNTKYDIDSYMVKKKHPGLDVMDDVIRGREVSVNKIDKESAIAGAYDYANSYLTLAALGTEFMIEKFKFSQGSYKEEKQQAINAYYDNMSKLTAAQSQMDDERVQKLVSDGTTYLNKALDAYSETPYIDDISEIKDAVSSKDYEKLQKEYEAIQKELDKYKNKS